MIKKVPMRTCIACRECKPKKELIRIVKTDSGFRLDKSGKLNGRGSYICNDAKCLNLLVSKKLLNKVYKTNVHDSDYLAIKEEFDAK